MFFGGPLGETLRSFTTWTVHVLGTTWPPAPYFSSFIRNKIYALRRAGCPSVGVTPTWWEFLEDDSVQLPCKAPGASGLPRLRCQSWASPGSASARPAAAGCLAHFTPSSSLRLLPPAVIPQTATVNVPRESVHICPSRCPLCCPQK